VLKLFSCGEIQGSTNWSTGVVQSSESGSVCVSVVVLDFSVFMEIHKVKKICIEKIVSIKRHRNSSFIVFLSLDFFAFSSFIWLINLMVFVAFSNYLRFLSFICLLCFRFFASLALFLVGYLGSCFLCCFYLDYIDWVSFLALPLTSVIFFRKLFVESSIIGLKSILSASFGTNAFICFHASIQARRISASEILSTFSKVSF